MHEFTIIVAKYAIVIPVIAYIWLAWTQRKSLKQMLLITVLSTLLAVMLVKIATTIHSDPRPFIRDGVMPYFMSSTDNGFPSDHTVFSSVIALIILNYQRKLGIGLTVLALLIGSARVISGVHHAQDIIGGLIIAMVSVLIAKLLANRLLRRQTKSVG
jgi:undecaprenyl-diphosphatase